MAGRNRRRRYRNISDKDIFDFWFEYEINSKGGARVMGAIAKLTDSGTPVTLTGNRDLGLLGLEDELGVILHRMPVIMEWDGLKCYIAHGDGLGPEDR